MKKAITLVFISSLMAVNSLIAQILSIDSCHEFAVRNYPLIKQYDLIEKSREYTIDNANKAYLPQVSLTAIGGYLFGGLPIPGATDNKNSFKFIGIGQVNQTIWDGGATKTQKKIINVQSDLDKANIDVTLHDLKSRVNQLYFGILLVDEQLKQLEIQNTILSNNINRLNQLHENGQFYKTDVDEIRVEQLKLNQQRKEFNYTRNGYVTMLSLLTGIKVNESTKLQKPLRNSQVSDLQIVRPELGLYKNQRNLLEAQSGMQRVNQIPKIGLVGAGVLVAPGINPGSSKATAIAVAGISASWNISGLYKRSNEKHLTEQSLNKINVQEETFLFNTNMQLTQTSAELEKQQAVLSDDIEIVALRKTIREGYQLKYENGISPLIDFLNATQKESEAQAQKALHEMQLLMKVYDYKTISGN